jgi:tetratricopeptide (TPR) repeat protein
VQDYLKALADERGRLAKLKLKGMPKLDVAAVLGFSARQLAAENRPLAERWQTLAVFVDSFDLAAAAAVWQVGTGKALEGLGELVVRSMVRFDQEANRYRLHDLMRDVAGVALAEKDQAALEARLEAARARHARHYCEVLAAAQALYLKGGAGVVAGLALYDLEQRSIAAGQAWAAARIEQDDMAARLAAEYLLRGGQVLHLRLVPEVMISWCKRALEAAVRIDDQQYEASAAGYLGILYRDLGAVRKGITWNERYLKLARAIGDRQGEGAALGNLGLAWNDLSEPRRAIEFHEQDLAIRREIGDRRGESNALGNLGIAWKDLGEPRRAIECTQQVLEIKRAIGDRRGEGNALGNLGNAWADLGEPRRAIKFYEQQLVIAREIGDRRGEGGALGDLGNAWYSLGEPRRAIEFYEQQLVIAREIGDRMGEGTARWNSAIALDALGERAEAVRRARAALAIFEAIGAKDRATKARAQLAEWGMPDGGS